MSKKEPKMIPCKKCGQTIASTAKACPHCGAKNAPPLYRRPWFIAIIVILVIGAIGGAAGNQTSPKNTTSKPVGSTSSAADSPANLEGSKPESIPEEVSQPETTPEPEITYTPYEVGQLIDELNENALKAADKHKGEYVELTGKLSVVDSSGKYISIDRTDEISFLEDIQCYITTDEQKSVVMELSKGDIVIVKGKIKNVGEVLGYSLDIDEIYPK